MKNGVNHVVEETIDKVRAQWSKAKAKEFLEYKNEDGVKVVIEPSEISSLVEWQAQNPPEPVPLPKARVR